MHATKRLIATAAASLALSVGLAAVVVEPASATPPTVTLKRGMTRNIEMGY